MNQTQPLWQHGHKCPPWVMNLLANDKPFGCLNFSSQPLRCCISIHIEADSSFASPIQDQIRFQVDSPSDLMIFA